MEERETDDASLVLPAVLCLPITKQQLSVAATTSQSPPPHGDPFSMNIKKYFIIFLYYMENIGPTVSKQKYFKAHKVFLPPPQDGKQPEVTSRSDLAARRTALRILVKSQLAFYCVLSFKSCSIYGLATPQLWRRHQRWSVEPRQSFQCNPSLRTVLGVAGPQIWRFSGIFLEF